MFLGDSYTTPRNDYRGIPLTIKEVKCVEYSKAYGTTQVYIVEDVNSWVFRHEELRKLTPLDELL